jgi:hypothetical protein
VRTAENHLPGPNEPIDFDTGSLITQGLSPSTGKPVRYYNFDVQSTTPAPLYVIYREDDDKPVESQLDLIDTLPDEKGYNDFRQIWKVYPRTMSPTRSPMQQTLRDAGYKMEKTSTLRNMPVVPDKSRARARLKGGSAELQRAWYQGSSRQIFQLRRGATVGGCKQRPAVAHLRELYGQSRRAEWRLGFRFQDRTKLPADSQRAGHTA